MESKFIYARTKDAFLRELPNIPEKLKPIVFIEDTREIWILGKYFSIGSPGVHITDENNIIQVEIGQSNFTMSSAGDNITIKKGTGNNIIFSSAGLTSVDSLYPLKWDLVIKKLSHEKTDVTPGNYGETSSSDNVNLFTIPHFTVNEWGHITNAENRNLKIRDYVEQIASGGVTGKYNLLLGYSNHELPETNMVRKALGLTFDTSSNLLKIPGGIEAEGNSLITGDLRVVSGVIIGDIQGNVSGTATPKIHLSTLPEHGGASLDLYGHVKLQDELTSEPEPSSSNTDINSANVTRGVAASPKMVWNVREELLGAIGGIDPSGGVSELEINGNKVPTLDFSGKVSVKTSGGLRGGIDPVTKELQFSSVSITGYDELNQSINIDESLEFTKDFEVIDNKVSIRWSEIN